MIFPQRTFTSLDNAHAGRTKPIKPTPGGSAYWNVIWPKMTENRFKENREHRFTISKPTEEETVLVVCPERDSNSSVAPLGEDADGAATLLVPPFRRFAPSATAPSLGLKSLVYSVHLSYRYKFKTTCNKNTRSLIIQ